VMLAGVTGWVALLDRARLAALRGAVAAAVTYVSNWWLISQHVSYFARFSPQSPLDHLWSLAVAEQFYLIWPWLVLLGLLAARSRRGARPRGHVRGRGDADYFDAASPPDAGLAAGLSPAARWVLAVATLALAGASAAAMAALYHPGYYPTRVYDGTDTRAFALLIGAALAFVGPTRRAGAAGGRLAARLLDVLGLAGLAVIGVLSWQATEYSAFMYRGGLVLLSLATAAVIAAVAAPGGWLGRGLGAGPLRWLGVRSYGIYLWHFPIIVLTTPDDSRESLARAALQVAATVLVAALSWSLVEEPVRHGALGRWWSRLRAAPATRPGRGAAWGQAALGAGVAAAAGACLAGLIPAFPAQPAAPAAAQSPPLGATPVPGAQRQGGAPVTAGGSGPPRTSCTSVADIGDSTSEGMISADYLPDKAERLGPQYRRVGVRYIRWGISGARSVVETFEGHPNAATVAQRLVARGYRGCWVLALGTNDTADVAVGSPVGLAARIAEMMKVTRGQPVLWVNVISLLDTGPYAESDMRGWNRALLRACARYPNMRVYDWAAAARRPWFISDGIHYTSAGYAQRSRLIARALAEAFPATATAGAAGRQGCEVHTAA
jgi:peptidoglycan/LPS O-acetylase OafA/YrhL